MPDYSIEVKHLTKKFGSFVAVDGISFSVEKGEIFGFIGANGAGKSTTIRMLCGLLRPTSGEASVAGYDVGSHSEIVRRNIGYMSQKFSLYNDLTVEENIRFFGGVYGLSNGKIKERFPWLLEMAGLRGQERRLAGELSAGWKQRLALGCAVIHDPQVVFLDEPTGGVDPLARRRFWDLIHHLSEKGVTVFVTTHYLDEAEYCNRIMLIHNGTIIARGSPKELKEKFIRTPVLEVECTKPIEAMEILEKEEGIGEVTVFGTYLHANVEDEEEGRKSISRLLSGERIDVRRIDRIMPSLEDVFVQVVEDKGGALHNPMEQGE